VLDTPYQTWKNPKSRVSNTSVKERHTVSNLTETKSFRNAYPYRNIRKTAVSIVCRNIRKNLRKKTVLESMRKEQPRQVSKREQETVVQWHTTFHPLVMNNFKLNAMTNDASCIPPKLTAAITAIWYNTAHTAPPFHWHSLLHFPPRTRAACHCVAKEGKLLKFQTLRLESFYAIIR
jgi:hypothetical protein